MDTRVNFSARNSKGYMTACSGFLFACLLAITLQVFLFSLVPKKSLPFLTNISRPTSTTFSVFSIPFSSKYPVTVTKLGEGFLKNPEDVCMDKDGVLYTATRDGWIKRMHRNGTWENWRMLVRDTLLGITMTGAGGLIVCDSEEVGEDGVTVLASHVHGAKIRFADDVIEASDGSLYFSVASTKFGLHNWYLDVLEAKPHGQLLKYDPFSNQTSILLDDLGFANGVALSADQDYLIVCETWKFRCLKYWLKEEIKGKTEVFIDNLPGGPDNINLAPDGSFWIALVQLASDGMEFVHTSTASKYFLATFPKFIKRVNGVYTKAKVINVGTDGNIIKSLEDPNGKVMSFVTSAVEFEGHLYLGSLNTDFVGKLPLNSP